jgi:hypothetical protein
MVCSITSINSVSLKNQVCPTVIALMTRTASGLRGDVSIHCNSVRVGVRVGVGDSVRVDKDVCVRIGGEVPFGRPIEAIHGKPISRAARPQGS